jgi:hypothetical protein
MHIFAFALQIMKRIAVIFFALFYLLVTTGLTLDVHYCGGKVVDIEVLGNADHCCSKVKTSCHKQEKNKCCKDETVVVQLDQWQIVSSLSSLEVIPVVVANFLPSTQIRDLPTASLHQSFYDLPPPKQQPLWLLYHSLTYYG